ncbi:MAG: class I SAM-dependent methyltransferase [Planctomycetota bacterium]|nr:class I SAM-dependent methyltransferase [Planctomycetota bacterium]
MKARLHHRDNCRLCSSRRLEAVIKLDPIPLAEKYTATAAPSDSDDLYPVDLYMCLDCGHVQILDVIDSEKLWDDYTYHSGQTKGIVEHFQEVAANVVARQKPAPGSLVIDVGSNDGSLLRAFKDRGFRVLGIDPAREIARKATESGIPTIPSLLTAELAAKIRKEHGPASVITAFNVFAHADDMNGMAASIKTMLAPDGVFQFEAQYLLDIVDKMLLGTIFHEHMSHHSLKPLVQFLKRHGLEVIDVERVTIQMGSIIGTAQPIGGPRKASPAVGELLALEEARKLDKPETVRQFSVNLDKLRKEVDVLKADWRKRGATVAGYGAARSGPTLIVQFGLEDVIKCIFDDHPQKVGKFSPGHRMPVVPTDELYKRKPDYVVILAFLHAKKIIANNRRYLDEGGRFVICCPKVQVVDKNFTGTL